MGDVKDFMRAYELICLVDQIHDFAANQHRKFVIKHLERWLTHFEERHTRSPHPDNVFRDLAEPKWWEIKEYSEPARKIKASNTRLQNRLKIQDNARDCHSKTLQKGRITKVSSKTRTQKKSTHDRQADTRNDLEPKRPRGRPRKSAETSVNPRSKTTTRKTRNRA